MKKDEVLKIRTKLLMSIEGATVSKAGNAYVILHRNADKKEFELTPYSVNKSTINNMGEMLYYPKNESTILMILKNGKLRIKLKDHFKSFTPKTFLALRCTISSALFNRSEQTLKSILMLNRKSEWLKNKPWYYLKYFNLLKSFKSEKEFLKFIGVTFRLEINKEEELNRLIIGFRFKNKHALLESDPQEVEDVIGMIRDTKNTSFYNSDKKMRHIHDELVLLVAKKKASKLSNKSVLPSYAETMLSRLNKSDLKIELLDSPRKLFQEGAIQHHCVGSRHTQLKESMFFSTLYDDKRYTFQISNRGILEAKGQFNKEPPKQLISLVTKTLHTTIN